jgi:5'-methylthioadenosine phosphorylase
MKIGIIGGSGLDNPDIFKRSKEKLVSTKYGKPSSPLTTGKIGGVDVVLLSRHGKDHHLAPSAVNYRANITALHNEGCNIVLATTAVGSLRKEIKPGNIVFPTQFIDFTKNRSGTFFDDVVKHTSMPDPFDAAVRKVLYSSCKKLGYAFNPEATLITIEGPRFSTRAESHMFRKLGADIINMSSCPEIALANELGLRYQSIAMSTDYDSWIRSEEPVSFEMVLKIMRQNAEKVMNLLIYALPRIH